MPFVPITGPILSNTVYRMMGGQNKLAAKDLAVTLPPVEFVTVEINSGGTVEIPVPQLINAMDATFAKRGVDDELALLVSPDPMDIEVRWVQLVTDPTNGSTRNVGCKAFLHCLPKGIPEISLTPGEASENEITYSVTSYRLVVDGEEKWAIDKFANVLRVDGVDYFEDIQWML